MSAHQDVTEGDLLWTPSAERIAGAPLTRFMAWLAAERGLTFEDYAALWRWSTTEIEAFWQAIWDYFEVRSSAPHNCVLESRAMPGARWFPGARLNFAEHVLRRERPGQPALLSTGEETALTPLLWDDLAPQVRKVAVALKAMGVHRGDRVVAYATNRPETMIAMLATVSLGAIWSSCSPDFGAKGVTDRLQQLAPKVIFCVDGYRYGGKLFDRRQEAAAIIGAIPTLERVVQIPSLGGALEIPGHVVTPWTALLEGPPVDATNFAFEQVPFDHPLWVLFSSGTTGLPKAIVHSHGGVLVEMLKALSFHMDFREGDRGFFYTTTGWMMWNFLACMMLAGVVPILFDGNPTWPEADTLWRVADEGQAALVGASPAFVDIMIKAGVVPRERYGFEALRTIMPAGAPVSAQHSAWFYRNVKDDILLATGSGGTDICSGFTGGVPIQPVYAGEMQARCLGIAARSLDEEGRELIDEVGEMVVTEPMPSMPVGFWNDPDGAAYRASYFEAYPGRWRQGDFFRVNARGGCFVLGRSDATLNRGGVRIGTAEIYQAVEALPFVERSLVVHLDLPDGRSIMPLFVKTAGGAPLTDEMRAAIAQKLRAEYTPRHVPDQIVQAPDIPMTLTGKKLEVPVRRILTGTPPEKAANPNAVGNPESLAFFLDFARRLREPADAAG
jgi:acetoacetyl-CoA synthetase